MRGWSARGLALAALSLLAAAPAHALERFGFKGVELGSSIVTVATNPKYECRASRAPGADTICSLRPQEKETVAGVPVGALFFFYADGKLSSITLRLEEKGFPRVVAALRSKYGVPAQRNESVRNLKDVAFENRIYAWKSGTDSLRAERYAGRLDQSAIRYTADALIERIERRRAAVAKDPSQDL